MTANAPIGLFDSGVGGLSIMKEVRRLLPREDLIYVADSQYCPYGEKRPEEIKERSAVITRFLQAEGAKLVVVACNTASVAALEFLRAQFPFPLVGVEPAVKQAALHSRNKKVGVLATGVTLTGERFTSLVERFGGDLTVINQACPGLVEKVEAGEIDSRETKALLEQYLEPLQAEGVDVVVLGCTHYPFLKPIVRQLVAPGVQVLDTGEPVARQVSRVLTEHNLLAPAGQRGREWFYTSGDPARVGPVVGKLWGGVGEGLARLPVPYVRGE
jgi:glutamate racemase